MKTNLINPTVHDKSNLNASAPPDKSAVRHTFTLGLDVDLRIVVAVIQCDHGMIPPAQKFTRARRERER